MEMDIQSVQRKSKGEDVEVAVYRIIQVPRNVEGVTRSARIQFVPRLGSENEVSNKGDSHDAVASTSFLIKEENSLKQHSTRQIIRIPIETRVDDSCNNAKRIFHCFICKRTFKHSSHLKRHINTHTGERIYKCDLCEKTFLDASTLSRHRKIHSGDKPWSCKICKKSFGTLGSLRRHITVHNQEGRPFQCETCMKRFPDNSSYKKHRLIHTGIKPHVCDICSKAFVHIGDLNGHRKIHVDIKPFNCDRCGKDFAKHSNYARHLLIHEGDKDFTCSICGVSYNFQSSLTRHLLTHVRRGNKGESTSDGNSENVDSPSSDVGSETNSENKKCSLKVTRTKMKHVNKYKKLNKSGEVPPKTKSKEVQKTRKEDFVLPDHQNSDPNYCEQVTTSNDPTVLPPPDETVSKQVITDDVSTLVTDSEDFGSTKDLTNLLMAPVIINPSSYPPEALHCQSEACELYSQDTDTLSNEDHSSSASKSDSMYALISLPEEINRQRAESSNLDDVSNIVVAVIDDEAPETIIPEPMDIGEETSCGVQVISIQDGNSQTESTGTFSADSSKEKQIITLKDGKPRTKCLTVLTDFGDEEMMLLNKAAHFILSKGAATGSENYGAVNSNLSNNEVISMEGDNSILEDTGTILPD